MEREVDVSYEQQFHGGLAGVGTCMTLVSDDEEPEYAVLCGLLYCHHRHAIISNVASRQDLKGSGVGKHASEGRVRRSQESGENINRFVNCMHISPSDGVRVLVSTQ